MESQILVVGPAWIGDMVMAQTLFKLLKYHHPSLAIDVVSPSWTMPLVSRMPEVRTAISFPFKHGELKLFKRYAFAKALRKKHYTHAIILPHSFKSALTAYWAKIPKRTGWVGESRYGLLNDIRRLNKTDYPLMIQQFAALGVEKTQILPHLEAFYPKLEVDERDKIAATKKFDFHTEQPMLALCPGAEFGPSKRWPIHYFSSVAQSLLNQGWQVVILGSQAESQLADDLMESTNGRCIDLTGKTTLTEAIDVLSLTQAVIANDSGLMHIAAALDRPLVVIYGSSSPAFTPPLGNNVAIANLSLDCSPCFKRQCPLGHHDCMQKLQPDSILSKLAAIVPSLREA